MAKYSMFVKLLLMATLFYQAMLGQPLYAQSSSTPPGTGKTLSAALLGNEVRSSTSLNPFAGQTVRINIQAADAASGFSADINVQQGAASGGTSSGVVLGDFVVVKSLDKLQCTPDAVKVVFSGQHYRQPNGRLVGDARIVVQRADSETLVFEIIDATGQRTTISSPGKMVLDANPCL